MQYSSPLISIIVPCYMVEKYLPRCIESIVNQTYRNLEVIIIDDGSPDRCREIAEDSRSNDNRVRVISKENGGISSARNIGIKEAKGEFIAFVDSDDYICSTHIEGLFRLLKSHDADISVNHYCCFRESEKPNPLRKEQVKLLSPLEAIQAMFYQKEFETAPWGKLYKKELFRNIEYPEGLVYEDLMTTYRVFLQAKRIAFCPDESYFYLIRNDSIDRGLLDEKKIEDAVVVFDILEKDKVKLSPVLKSFNSRLFSFALHIFVRLDVNNKHRNFFWKKAKEYRCGLMFDHNARLKVRFMAFLSFLGLNNIYALSRFISKI